MLRVKCLNNHLSASSPRPARPATWVSSVNARSEAEKSGSIRAISAEMTPTSVTPGRSSPFAIICVPTSISASRLAKRSSSCSCARRCLAVSRSQRSRRALGKWRAMVSSTFLSPGQSNECSGYYTVDRSAESCFVHYSSGRAEYARLNDMSVAYRSGHILLQIHTRDTVCNLLRRAGSSRG